MYTSPITHFKMRKVVTKLYQKALLESQTKVLNLYSQQGND